MKELNNESIEVLGNHNTHYPVETTINWLYPKDESVLEIVLNHVRASDGIQVLYDFDRDGWVIKQPKSHYEQIEPKLMKEMEEWFEVAFLPSWNLEEDE